MNGKFFTSAGCLLRRSVQTARFVKNPFFGGTMRKGNLMWLVLLVLSASLFLGCADGTDENADGGLVPSNGDGGRVRLTVMPAGPLSVKKGETQQFTAYLNGNKVVSVTWKLSVNPSGGGSVLDGNGLLTVGTGEKAETLTATATVRVDGKNVSASKTVTVFDNGGTVVPTSKSFWAMNLTDATSYTLTADLLAEGEHCKVWVEQASQERVSSETANKIANEYDTNIYNTITGAFDIGSFSIDNGGNTMEFSSIMEFADRLTDGDGKLSILLLDIRDGYTKESGSYTAGYFYAVDFFSESVYTNSNETDMIYIDTYPTEEPAGENAMRTLAHEMQHLMNFATTLAVRRTGNSLNQMDVWVDEGLSSVAEYLYGGTHVAQRYEWFNKDTLGTIARGNNFFVWGNLKTASILDDYATVYLFFQWLRIQAGDGGIYKDIIASEYPDYNAVTGAAKNRISWFTELSWKDLFEPWLAANYINAETGKYGYKNDTTLKDVKARTASNGITSLQLLPGEAVYSKTTTDGSISDYASGSGGNIRYAGLKREGSEGKVSDSNTHVDGVLLTYNGSTSGDQKETGRLTGVAEPVDPQTVAGLSRSLSIGGVGAPVQIDARDMLARNGNRDWAEIFNGAVPAALTRDE
jgi:hypothetical protein